MNTKQSRSLRIEIDFYERKQNSKELTQKKRVDAGIKKVRLTLKLKELLYEKGKEL